MEASYISIKKKYVVNTSIGCVVHSVDAMTPYTFLAQLYQRYAECK